MTAAPLLSGDWLSGLDQELRVRICAPPPILTVSEWADRYRILSRVASAEPGRWRTDRAPYQRGIMDACSDPLIEQVVIMKPAQIGYTEMLGNVVGFYADQDPAPILIVQPTLDMARAWSTDRLRPMLRESPRLKGKVRESSRRHSGDTLLHKEFPGGHLTIVGANSPSGLASRPIRVALFDEVDRYPASAGSEGDPVTLGIKRTATFWNRKIVLGSTPGLKGLSRIEAAWQESDQRRYYVPCPECDHRQLLVWRNLKWDDGRPETAAYVCESCGGLIGEDRKVWMLERGAWVAENPGHRTAGFHLNGLYSPWARWADLAREWLECQRDVSRLQVFVNTVLAETWEERGGSLEPGALESRAEAYPAPVPAGVAVLTCGVDVQDTRLEYTVMGWGHGEEAWLIHHGILHGDPTTKAPWAALDAVLIGTFQHEGGPSLPILAACIDSGHHTESVYAFCRPRFGRRVYAIKGSATPGAPFVPRRASRNNKGRVPLYLLGTDTAKDLIYGRLKLAVPGPGYLHTPADLDAEWYVQVTAERLERVQINGRWRRRYVLPRGARNEALDCLVYVLAALYLAPVARTKLGQIAASRRTIPPTPPTTAADASESPDREQELAEGSAIPKTPRTFPVKRPHPPKRTWLKPW